ncbi:MAG TPA: hypothetical protein VGQ85_03690 [Candidatus Limnocylindrales bacterium]|nr:hypothetical protein [Candidatus Limnocylindrales bacterium]
MLRRLLTGSIGMAIVAASLAVVPVVAVNGGACAQPFDPVIALAEFTTAGQPNPIVNPYFPLRPGTTFVYDGTLAGLPQHVVTTVTATIRTIDGIPSLEVRDTLWLAGLLAEDTLDWYAQDDGGNVWYFGEDTKEYDANGNVISTAGSWLAGVNGAAPGILVEAQPRGGDTFRQEFAAGVAEDMASVMSLTKHVTVPFGSFDRVVETKEFSCIEAGLEHKFYAPGVGNVLVVAKGERLELVSVTGP